MKYIDAEKLKELLNAKYEEFTEKAKKDCPLQYQYMADGLDIAEQFIDSLQQEQPEDSCSEKEIEYSIRFLNGHHTLENGERWYKGRYEELKDFARHFYGLRNRVLEEAAMHVYESWMGGTMDDVRRDMFELGKVLNARKEE